MASTVITAPELHERDDDYIRRKLLEYVPMFRQNMDRGAGSLIGDLESIIEHHLWERIGFNSMEEYAVKHLDHSEKWCHEVIDIYRREWSYEERMKRTVGDLDAAAKARAQADPESPKYVDPRGGRPRKGETRDNVPSSGGNRKDKALRRLARERPDLLERFEQGELSANAAALEAGFRRPSVQITDADPSVAAQRIRKKLGKEFADRLRACL
jgi:hypothetical protein